MPKIGANFKFNSQLPNFERDSMSKDIMESTLSSDLDIGHIVYCTTDGLYYKYKGTSSTFEGSWEVLIDTITNLDIDRICV